MKTDDIREFHTRFGIAYEGKPRSLPYRELQNRIKFMRQELQEYEIAADELNFVLEHRVNTFTPLTDEAEITHLLASSLDALVDLVYVALGTAHLQGFDFDEAWRRVHEANMKKRRVTSTNADGSIKNGVSKPADWEAPEHDDLVEDNAHRVVSVE